MAKLHFFANISAFVGSFLTKYQMDKPMLLFVYFDLKDFISKLLQTVEKPTVFEHCKSEKKIMDIDVSNNQNLISIGKI